MSYFGQGIRLSFIAVIQYECKMRGSSNTMIYIIAGVIILHLVVGFAWLAYKLNKKNDDDD